MAAQIAGVPGELAATWLTEGRALRSVRHPPRESYRRMCLDFATQWDQQVPKLIARLRENLTIHAMKDPKACITALQSYEREYHERTKRRPKVGVDLVGEDLAEDFMPLELAQAATGALQRSAKFTRHADGSSSAEFTEAVGLDLEMEGRTEAELEHYATFGEWPHVALPRVDEKVVDALGEAVELDQDMAELTQALAGGPPVAGKAAASSGKATARPPKAGPKLQAAAPAPAAPPARPLRRIDPQALLRDLGPVPGGQAIEDAPQPAAFTPPVKVPPHVPLRRIDMSDR